ncbi:hypothetical protein G9A89_022971 [Geosiphon pyriformis]|nr:hypothetical protein G9A89_022971 [Geosiphon pyriformis]
MCKDTTDAWYQSLAVKPQTFNDFKTKFLRYFSNNNSINKLANFFTTIKQGDTKAVTTYLEHFYRNLCQIQAIQADYFTAPQILNQFIRGLCNNLLQRVCPMHLVDLSTAVTHARDFEAAELEANHAQAVNLVMNRSSKLDSKLKQFSESINRKLEEYLTDNRTIYQSSQRRNNSGNMNHFQNQSHPLSSAAPSQSWQPEILGSYSRNSGTDATQNLNFQNYLSLLVTPENTTPNNQELKQTPISNIPPAMIIKDESLDAIFSFKLKKPSTMLLFNRAALEEKPITTMYTNVKIDGHPIKLILNSGSAGSIII